MVRSFSWRARRLQWWSQDRASIHHPNNSGNWTCTWVRALLTADHRIALTMMSGETCTNISIAARQSAKTLQAPHMLITHSFSPLLLVRLRYFGTILRLNEKALNGQGQHRQNQRRWERQNHESRPCRSPSYATIITSFLAKDVANRKTHWNSLHIPPIFHHVTFSYSLAWRKRWKESLSRKSLVFSEMWQER